MRTTLIDTVEEVQNSLTHSQVLPLETFFGTCFVIVLWKQLKGHRHTSFAGSLEAAYSLNWGAREIWGKGGDLGTFMISRPI